VTFSRRAVSTAIASRLSVDERALAALRVSLAVVVLLDLAIRLPDAAAFYTDAGVLPRSLLAQQYPAFSALSLHALSGALWWQYLLFGATAVAALAMAAGYRSRLAAFLTFALVLSLHARNPVVLNAGDSLLRRLLLWSVLLPIGACWSVDAARREGGGTASHASGREPAGRAVAGSDAASDDRQVRSVATVGVIVQVLAVYVVNLVLKSGGPAWHGGVAARLVFGMDALTVGVGEALAGQDLLLTAGTYAWLVVLALTPLLVLATGWPRALVVGAFAAGHLSMALTLRLGVFPLVSLAALLVFVPPAAWDRLGERVRPRVADRAGAVHAWVVERAPRSDGGRWTRRGRTRVGPSAGTAAAVLLAFVLVWNAAGLGLLALPSTVTDRVDPTERRWDMFAPEPRATGGWFATVGTTGGGERVDLYAGTDGLGDSVAGVGPPPDVDVAYPSHRWYVYLTALRDAPTPALRERFGAYLCERWTDRNDGSLAEANVTFVARQVRLDAPDDYAVRPIERANCTA